MRSTVLAALLSVSVSTLGGCFNEETASSRTRRTCSEFSCQGAAQQWHNAHPEDGLDGDGDGIACEHLPRCSRLSTIRSGRYSGDLIEHPVDIEIVVEPHSTSGNILGRMRWGPELRQTGEIVSLAIDDGSALLEVAPFAIPDRFPAIPLANYSFGVWLDTDANRGLIAGVDPAKLPGLPNTAEFVITEFVSSPSATRPTLGLDAQVERARQPRRVADHER